MDDAHFALQFARDGDEAGADDNRAQALKQDMANAHVTVAMMQELQKAGCDGFIVKASGATEQMSFVMQLVTAAHKNFPASMFEIPAGYTVMTTQSMLNSMMMQQQAKQR